LRYSESMRRLIIRPGGIGDFIASLPALECLRTGYTEVWTTTRNVPLVRWADRVRPIASTGIDRLGIVEPPPGLVEEMRAFDSIVSWYGANRDEFRDTVASLGLGVQFFRALPPEGAGRHAADFYLDQVRTLGPVDSDGMPRIRCDVPKSDFAAIHPFSGSGAKNWPLANFRALARQLEATMPVKWCAGPEDPPLPEAERFDDLYELACWLASARLYIGNDSGISHLAAATGTPVIAYFGPTDPVVWAPRGPRVEIRRW